MTHEQIEDANTSNENALVSLTAMLEEPEIAQDSGQITTLRFGSEPAFISLFTDNAVPASAHWLEETATWSGGYVRCCGEACPACRAGLDSKDFLLLPVLDHLYGKVVLLRIPTLKGPGKLLTELGPILKSSGREKLIVQTSREKWTFIVTVKNEAPVDPDMAALAQNFAERMKAGTIDLAAGFPIVSAEEMASHEMVAKRLSLTAKV